MSSRREASVGTAAQAEVPRTARAQVAARRDRRIMRGPEESSQTERGKTGRAG